ncbi:hypothetical protein [Bacillus velezensis]|uniref:hypothetical protein n=1 Tax=Bacillus velezensis TaxID=492670 RepID=UPI000C15671B|nr:hypothetical protein [Bacillus velezensis]QHK05271.1 hypothetical protein C7M19_00200 [Bacillus velezensis]QHK10794.1 hypothetical protein C7M20_01918 [Bacillus velezensis]
MDLQKIQWAAIKVINSIRNRGLEVDVIQFRDDVWDAIVENNKRIGFRNEPNPKFAGCKAERQESLTLAFRITASWTHKDAIRELDVVDLNE